ncbi:MAG: hypothetical protein JXX29_13850 [Deltaproteobacteria bacterium]|nr:hypothetical protein [Deltaproteobacteria bacterium]MBN2672760.1 hypothetical protein [Deltaproteobacteria bacterium]
MICWLRTNCSRLFLLFVIIGLAGGVPRRAYSGTAEIGSNGVQSVGQPIGEQTQNQSPVKTSSAKWPGYRIQLPEFQSSLRLRGLVHADAVFFPGNGTTPSHQFDIRRARLAFDGNAGKLFSFRIQPQWSSSSAIILDAYIDVSLSDAFNIRVGRMKTPLGIEMLQSASVLMLPERGLSSALVPNRDTGVQISGNFANGIFEYAVGIGNGTTDQGRSAGNTQNNFDEYIRFGMQPFKSTRLSGVEKTDFGIAASYGAETGTVDMPALPGYKTSGRTSFAAYNADVFADGNRWRLNPWLRWYYKPVGFISEYVFSSQEVMSNERDHTVGNHAWMAGLTVVATGEDASYRGIVPNRSFGAIELAARFGGLYLDKGALDREFFTTDSSSSAHAWGIGVNYWSPTIFRLQTAFEQIFLKSRPREDAVFIRCQISL